MKKIFNYLVIGAVITFTSISCKNWLDVHPSGVIKAEDLYAEGSGFRVALNGIYGELSDPTLYGKELSWGMMSVMSSDYSFEWGGLSSYSAYGDMYYGDYNNSRAISLVDPIWNKIYFAIANANVLIDKVKDADASSFALGELEKNLIMGEAYALRAKMHFDILRLFAPSVKADDGKAYMPYYDKPGLSKGEPDLTISEVFTKILADLDEAEKLIKPFDTHPDRPNSIKGNIRHSAGSFGLVDGATDHLDVFFTQRGFRMNLAAVMHMRMTTYWYNGDIDKAYEAAQAMRTFHAEQSIFAFTYEHEIAEDPKCSNESFFSLSYPEMFDLYEPHLEFNEQVIDEDMRYLGLSEELIGLFDIDKADRRYNILTEITPSSQYRRSKKFKENAGIATEYEDLIPVLKYADIFFVEAEYHATKGDYSEAAATLDYACQEIVQVED